MAALCAIRYGQKQKVAIITIGRTTRDSVTSVREVYKMRLIDGDRLYDTVCDIVGSAHHDVMSVKEILRLIENSPSAYVQPVVEYVRCKDCMFSRMYTSGELYCELHERYSFGVHPDGFCYRGVTK